MIETSRLLLRAWRDDDRDPSWVMAQDPEFMRYLLPCTRQESDAAIARMMAMQAEHGLCLWAMERRSDRRLLGCCGLLPPREPTFEYEIGWRLARDAWGQGYAHEAAKACLSWAWQSREPDVVVAITVPENARSRRLMERLGMVRDVAADFEHPAIPEGHRLRRHVLYRIARPA